VVVAHLHGAPAAAALPRSAATGGYRRPRGRSELPAEAKRVEFAPTAKAADEPGGHALPALDGCIDVDHRDDAFTNTLPSNGSGSRLGESRDLSGRRGSDAPSLRVSRSGNATPCCSETAFSEVAVTERRLPPPTSTSTHAASCSRTPLLATRRSMSSEELVQIH